MQNEMVASSAGPRRARVGRKEKWATASTMSVLSAHFKLKEFLGRDPGRVDVAKEVGLLSKSVIQGHFDKCVEGELVTKGRRGVLELTPFGKVMLDRYNERGSV